MIDCKVEVKLRWTKYCVLSLAGTDNPIDNDINNNIIFTIKDTKRFVPVVTVAARDDKKLSKLLSKGIERSVCWNEYKTKRDKKNTTNKFRYFLELSFVGVIRLFVLVYSNQDNASKRFKAKRCYLSKGISDKYYVIIIGKNFYDQPIHSDRKRYEEIRNLKTGQGEDYTTGCVLDYEYIKNQYKLIAVELSRQKELDADPKAIQ